MREWQAVYRPHPEEDNLEVHRAYISGMVNGKGNPTLALIQKLTETPGVAADELINKTEKNNYEERH